MNAVVRAILLLPSLATSLTGRAMELHRQARSQMEFGNEGEGRPIAELPLFARRVVVNIIIVRKFLSCFPALLLLACWLTAQGCAYGQPTETVLYNFRGGPNDGTNINQTGVIQGADGNFYGTTQAGGTSSIGIAYQVTPSGTETVLHNFTGSTDGNTPAGGLIWVSGNLYGTAQTGGAHGMGSVFQMTPSGTVTLVHSFTSISSDGVNSDGAAPSAALILGSGGNFYGTTNGGGAGGWGTVFKITPTGTLTLLHSFQDGTVSNDGRLPEARVIQGSDGNLYGITNRGGSADNGTVFMTTLSGTTTILHSFGSITNDGVQPQAGLIEGLDGNFYGTTSGGGPPGVGAGLAFKITSSGTFTILHTFTGSPDGANPLAGLALGPDGNFYGVTELGGTANWGTLFKMTPSGTVTILHSFLNNGIDGVYPMADLYLGSDSSFYGTTDGGGSTGNGTVFKFTIWETFSQWVARYSLTGGTTGTPENDGLPNLYKYLFDINPTEIMTAADVAALPAAGMTTDGTGTYLTLTYRQYAKSTGITINVQTSTDLLTWSTVTSPTITQVGTDSITQDPIMQAKVPAAGSREFIRLNVTLP